MAMETTSGPLEFEVGSVLFYVVVGAGGILALLTLCIALLCLSIIIIFVRRNRTRPAAFNSNQQIELQENSEVHNGSDVTTLSKEGKVSTQTTIVDGQIEPQCYTIEENPAYTTTTQDLFNWEDNPAYTTVETAHQKQGIPIYHEILDQPMK